MYILKTEKGSLPLVVLVAVLLLGTVGFYFISITTLDLDISHGTLSKTQSRHAAEYGLQQYLKHFKAEIFEEPEVPTSGYFPDEEKKEAYYETLSVKDVDVEVTPGVGGGVPIHDTGLYSMSPPVESSFEYEEDLSNELDGEEGQFAVSGVFNPNLNSKEFYIAFYTPIEDMIKIYVYRPRAQDGIRLLKEFSVPELAGCVYDALDISVVWDSNHKAPFVYVGLGFLSDNLESFIVSVYEYQPVVDHLILLTQNSSPVREDEEPLFSLSGIWNKKLSSKELFLTTFSDHKLETYNNYPGMGGSFVKLIEKDVNKKSIDTEAVWDENINSRVLYLGALDFEEEIARFYSLQTGEQFLPIGKLTTTQDTLGLAGDWDETLNASTLFVTLGSKEDETMETYQYYPVEDYLEKMGKMNKFRGTLAMDVVLGDFSEAILIDSQPGRLKEVFTERRRAYIIGKSLNIDDEEREHELARTTLDSLIELECTRYGRRKTVLNHLKVLEVEYDPLDINY